MSEPCYLCDSPTAKLYRVQADIPTPALAWFCSPCAMKAANLLTQAGAREIIFDAVDAPSPPSKPSEENQEVP